jgi:transcriptional regulator with XRE-family HTH domain
MVLRFAMVALLCSMSRRAFPAVLATLSTLRRKCKAHRAVLGDLSSVRQNTGVSIPDSDGQEPLGVHLKRARQAVPLSLRAVEAQTEGVTNGYLSQIEGGQIRQPSPNVLYQLAQVYGLDYRDLLVRAAHRVPSSVDISERDAELAGIPLRALADLSEDERRQVTEFIGWIKSRRS